jgi:hypothetical protein
MASPGFGIAFEQVRIKGEGAKLVKKVNATVAATIHPFRNTRNSVRIGEAPNRQCRI